MLERASHGRNHIGQEEVTETNKTEGRLKDVPERLCQLNTPPEIEAMDRHEAKSNKEGKHNDREVRDSTVVEFISKLDHRKVPRKAEEPDCCEDEG